MKRKHTVQSTGSMGSLTFLRQLVIRLSLHARRRLRLLTHHCRSQTDGHLHFWFLAGNNDDVGFFRLSLHHILIFSKGLPVKRTRCITCYRGDSRAWDGTSQIKFRAVAPQGELIRIKSDRFQSQSFHSLQTFIWEWKFHSCSLLSDYLCFGLAVRYK